MSCMGTTLTRWSSDRCERPTPSDLRFTKRYPSMMQVVLSRRLMFRSNIRLTMVRAFKQITSLYSWAGIGKPVIQLQITRGCSGWRRNDHRRMAHKISTTNRWPSHTPTSCHFQNLINHELTYAQVRFRITKLLQLPLPHHLDHLLLPFQHIY